MGLRAGAGLGEAFLAHTEVWYPENVHAFQLAAGQVRGESTPAPKFYVLWASRTVDPGGPFPAHRKGQDEGGRTAVRRLDWWASGGLCSHWESAQSKGAWSSIAWMGLCHGRAISSGLWRASLVQIERSVL